MDREDLRRGEGLAPGERLREPGAVRLPPLDGLRGLAVLAVVLYHATVFETATSGAGRASLFVLRGGWCGVDLFFVLSGFLITGILLDSRGATNYFRAFYARRVLRIFPLYYVSLLVLVPLFGVSLAEGAWYATYLQNVRMALHGWPSAPLSHFWSLAVEEQYYLVWPLAVLLLPRPALAGLSLAALFAVPLARTWAFSSGVSEIALYALTPFRLDALLAGGLVAIAVRSTLSRRRLAAAGVLLATGGAVVAVWLVVREGTPLFLTASMVTAGYSVLAILFAGLVLHVTAAGDASLASRLLSNRALRAAGTYSYAMYVFHWPVTWSLRKAGFLPAALAPGLGGWALYLAGLVAVVTGLALLSWRVLEAPFLSLKARFEFRPVSPGDGAAATEAT